MLGTLASKFLAPTVSPRNVSLVERQLLQLSRMPTVRVEPGIQGACEALCRVSCRTVIVSLKRGGLRFSDTQRPLSLNMKVPLHVDHTHGCTIFAATNQGLHGQQTNRRPNRHSLY